MSTSPQRSSRGGSCIFPVRASNPVAWLTGLYLLLSAMLAMAAPGWDAAASLQTARYSHTATLLPDGKVLVVGGKSNVPLATAELYEPGTNAWTAAASLATARWLHTATLLLDGKVLVVGGQSIGQSNVPFPTAELYDPATNAWTAAGALASGRWGHTATLLPNGKVLVAGGYDKAGLVATTELYDPATNVWTAGGTLAGRHLYHTATLLPNGKVLVAGGGADSRVFFVPAGSELYDPATNAWTAAGALARGRALHTATLLPNGKVLVTGGQFGGTSAELYDPATNAWTAAGSLAEARYIHTATLLADGTVLVAGGYGDAYPYYLASAELYDPATNAWTDTAALTLARDSHTATLLPNGKVLIAGGYDIALWLASAELFDLNFSGSGSLLSFPVHRFFNNNANGHFFTISESEKDTVIANYPWFRNEDVGFFAYSTQYAGTLPVYRFFDTNSGNHFFTMIAWEKDMVISNYPWFRYEGTGFYAYFTQQAGTLPVYRFANTNSGGHFYTISESEKNTVIADYPWFRYEGIGFYAPAQ